MELLHCKTYVHQIHVFTIPRHQGVIFKRKLGLMMGKWGYIEMKMTGKMIGVEIVGNSPGNGWVSTMPCSSRGNAIMGKEGQVDG